MQSSGPAGLTGRARQVAVCGPAAATESEREAAYRVGELLAARGAVVVCGGGGGVMGAAAAGARAGGGLVVGVLPGLDTEGASPDLSVVLPTGLGQARNVVIVSSADAVVAVGGSWGTLSEVALATRLGVPVVALGGWRIVDAAGGDLDGAPRPAAGPEQAVDLALG